MPTFVFKKKLPPHLLKNFLDPICIKNNTQYIVNYETLKRAKYNNHYIDFINMIRPYYYTSKQYYLDDPTPYKRFLTILRQLCKYNKFTYISTTVYDRGKASLEYRIYYTSIRIEDDTVVPHTDGTPSSEEANRLPK